MLVRNAVGMEELKSAGACLVGPCPKCITRKMVRNIERSKTLAIVGLLRRFPAPQVGMQGALLVGGSERERMGGCDKEPGGAGAMICSFQGIFSPRGSAVSRRQ